MFAGDLVENLELKRSFVTSSCKMQGGNIVMALKRWKRGISEGMYRAVGMLRFV